MIQCQALDHGFPPEMLSAGGLAQTALQPGFGKSGESLLCDQLRNNGFETSIFPSENFSGWTGARGQIEMRTKREQQPSPRGGVCVHTRVWCVCVCVSVCAC